MSLTIIAPILLIKKLLKEKLTARWHYYIWIFLIIRLLIPYTPEISLHNFFLNQPSDYQSSTAASWNTNNISDSLIEPSKNTDNYQSASSKPVTAPTNENKPGYLLHKEGIDISFLATDIFSKIWLAGILLLLIYFAIIKSVMVYKINKTRLNIHNESIEDMIEICKRVLNIKSSIRVIYQQHVKAPAVYGVIKPKLLLPRNISDRLTTEELRYVILHELSHIKRRDTLAGICQLLLCIIHWFNPQSGIPVKEYHQTASRSAIIWSSKILSPVSEKIMQKH